MSKTEKPSEIKLIRTVGAQKSAARKTTTESVAILARAEKACQTFFDEIKTIDAQADNLKTTGMGVRETIADFEHMFAIKRRIEARNRKESEKLADSEEKELVKYTEARKILEAAGFEVKRKE
jgi:SUMO ligase MMS21 Smc5/6 complex component